MDVTIHLTVIERYTETVNSIVLTRENRATGDASPFRAHDSDAELRKISIEFLVFLFGNSSVSPSGCLVDFSNNCRGKQDELRDIEHNRNTFVILSAEATVASVSISPDRQSAEVIAPCVFRDREIATGHEGTSRGDCFLTAVYEREPLVAVQQQLHQRIAADLDGGVLPSVPADASAAESPRGGSPAAVARLARAFTTKLTMGTKANPTSESAPTPADLASPAKPGSPGQRAPCQIPRYTCRGAFVFFVSFTVKALGQQRRVARALRGAACYFDRGAAMLTR